MVERLTLHYDPLEKEPFAFPGLEGDFVRYSDYADLQRQLSEAVERAEKAEADLEFLYSLDDKTGSVREGMDLGRACRERATAAEARAVTLAATFAEVERYVALNCYDRLIEGGWEKSERLSALLDIARAALHGEPSPKPQPSTSWPIGCQSPSSCTRHMGCMYFGCDHEGQNIKPEIEAALAKLTGDNNG